MPQLFKIGMTDRTPDERSVELFTTGVPTPFEIEISIKVQDARYCEKLIFQKLSKYRLANNRGHCQKKPPAPSQAHFV